MNLEPQSNALARIRRTVLTAGMAGLLLVGGGSAVVLAQSPDASPSTAPSATTSPDESTTQHGNRGDCPEKNGGSNSDVTIDAEATPVS